MSHNLRDVVELHSCSRSRTLLRILYPKACPLGRGKRRGQQENNREGEAHVCWRVRSGSAQGALNSTAGRA